MVKLPRSTRKPPEIAEKGKRGTRPKRARGATRTCSERLECGVFFRGRKSNRLVLVLLFSAGSLSLSASPRPRVVVLGFDGADHRLVTQWMAEGKLPNLSKLAASGGFAPLRPTIPAQTPASWATC